MKNKISIYLMFALLIMTACKSTKSLPKTNLEAPKAVGQLIDLVQREEPQFKTANISKMSLSFNVNQREVNVSATCKIKKDSAIYISIQPFMGIELFKAELTTDSIRVFDKMNHKYYVSNYGFFSRRFGVNVDFYSFQALLSARLFCVGKKEIQVDSCKLITSVDGKNKIEYNNQNMLQTTEVSPLNKIQQVVLKDKNSDYQLLTDYTDYVVTNGISFPQKISLRATSKNSKASCDFSILRVEFNTDITFIPTNPERFTRGDIDQLLKK